MMQYVLVRKKRAMAQAFPVAEGSNSGKTDFGSSHAAPLPTGITAGELLLLQIGYGANQSSTITTPSGWTQLYNITLSSSTHRFACYYKMANGSEGSTLSLTGSRSGGWVSIAYRISGWSGTPEAATASGGSALSNPPNLSPSWGSAKTLWLAAGAHNVTTMIILTAPTGYSDIIQDAANPGLPWDSPRLASARRELEAASDDPGAFTGSGNASFWAAATIAIQPA